MRATWKRTWDITSKAVKLVLTPWCHMSLWVLAFSPWLLGLMEKGRRWSIETSMLWVFLPLTFSEGMAFKLHGLRKLERMRYVEEIAVDTSQKIHSQVWPCADKDNKLIAMKVIRHQELWRRFFRVKGVCFFGFLWWILKHLVGCHYQAMRIDFHVLKVFVFQLWNWEMLHTRIPMGSGPLSKVCQQRGFFWGGGWLESQHLLIGMLNWGRIIVISRCHYLQRWFSTRNIHNLFCNHKYLWCISYIAHMIYS